MNKLMISAVVGVALTAGVFALAPYASAQGVQKGPSDGTAQQLRAGLRDGSGQNAGKESSLERRAAALGMGAEQLQAALDSGKTMQDVASEKGIELEQFQARMGEAREAHWRERGLSSEEIAERQAEREQHQADCDGSGDGENGYRGGREA